VSRLLIVTIVALVQTGAPSALPDTPQGKHVAAWVSGLNTSAEAFAAAHREHGTKVLVEKRTEAERAEMYRRLRADFGTLTIQKVLRATGKQIQFTAPAREDGIGTFTFEFEDKAPFLISSIAIDVQGPS
jgi:hypothetical protein